jgi:hypothetical protein
MALLMAWMPPPTKPWRERKMKVAPQMDQGRTHRRQLQPNHQYLCENHVKKTPKCNNLSAQPDHKPPSTTHYTGWWSYWKQIKQSEI